MEITRPLKGLDWHYPEIFATEICLNLGLMSDYTQSYRKYLLSLRSSSLSGELYKPSELVRLGENLFNIMLILGLSFQRVVGAYKIYTEFVPCQFVQDCH